ncbi:MAG: IS4 family transposase [Sedimenticolaceae bacterium]
MHPSQRACRQQQKRVHSHATNSDSYAFFNLLTGPRFLDQVESLLPEHRERRFPPTETLSMFLAQAMSADRSCQSAVNDAAIKRLTGGLAVCSTHTGAYCRARKRLPLDMVSTLTRYTGSVMSEHTPQSWLWRGRPVRLVDGASVALPDTADNQEAYPQPRSQQPGLGFPLCRLVGIICLASGAVLNAALGPCRGKGSDEQSLLRSILDTVEDGDILLGDAFFATYFLLCTLQEKGVDGVFEQQGARRRSTDFRRGQRLGPRDHLIELHKPKKKPDWMSQAAYDQAPAAVKVRELSTNGKILMTTLLCPKRTSKGALKALYRDRWHVELDLRNIKTTLGMERLSCRTPAMAEKEIWVYLLAYNLIRLLMAQAALLADLRPRQLSFKHTLQLWIAWRHSGSYDDSHLARLFILIAQQRVGNRPGRIEPRAVKRRPKPFPLLTKPRQPARDDVRKNGHPKKLK